VSDAAWAPDALPAAEPLSIAIVGAGFAGAVLARELAETGGFVITVFDARSHIAGNCHTARDAETGVMVHTYGPHIFHTDNLAVWDYVNCFGEFRSYINRVKAVTERGVHSLPVNLLTINQFFGETLDPQEAREYIGALGERTHDGDPETFEEQALAFLGRELYENFFHGYTTKQWGVEPSELPASILKRLPVRFSYDDNYYSSRYQGIPVDGYTAIVEAILDHPAITVELNRRFERGMAGGYAHTFTSGPLDEYFGHSEGRLAYRTLDFERGVAEGDHQGTAVLNYCDASVPYTRIAEHKHFTPWESHERTVYYREYSRSAEPGDIPYYPVRLTGDKEMLARYAELAEKEPATTFIGRLGTYRYLDMHVVIAESLALAARCASTPQAEWPAFSAPVL
jgi:UDP-galactopyranose mutase